MIRAKIYLEKFKLRVIIQKLIMQVDLKKIKGLQMLLSVLREIEDYSNGNGDADPETIPSTV